MFFLLTYVFACMHESVLLSRAVGVCALVPTHEEACTNLACLCVWAHDISLLLAQHVP
jgi:hypothetical protein